MSDSTHQTSSAADDAPASCNIAAKFCIAISASGLSAIFWNIAVFLNFEMKESSFSAACGLGVTENRRKVEGLHERRKMAVCRIAIGIST